MRQVITEREEVHRMSSKNKTEVLIDGKIYTLSGYESEEYLQRVATYINNKLAELKKTGWLRKTVPGVEKHPAGVECCR